MNHLRFVLKGPDGTDYTNHSRFVSIVVPERIEFDHLSAPYFHMTMSLTELPGHKTRLVWLMHFESAAIRNAVAKIVVPANEQNFDRLTEELQRTNN